MVSHHEYLAPAAHPALQTALSFRLSTVSVAVVHLLNLTDGGALWATGRCQYLQHSASRIPGGLHGSWQAPNAAPGSLFGEKCWLCSRVGNRLQQVEAVTI